MNLNDIWILFQFLAEKLNYAKDISIEQYNSLLKYADRELRKELYGNENSRNGYETSQNRTDSLLHSKGTSTIALVAGTGNLPSDYYHISSILYGTVKVDVITDYELTERLGNAVLAPTLSYPVAILNTGTITVYPNTISSITFKYLKQPTAPNYVLKTENGIDVYDSVNSVQLQWPQDNYIDIIRLMLKYLGLSVDRTDILQYVEQKQGKEND